MLIKPPIEKLLPKVESRYTLAMLVAKRARQLVDGAQPMVESDTPNLVTLACEEVAADKVICVPGLHTPVVPLRPEIEEARRLAREMAANQASLDAFPELMDGPFAAADSSVEPQLLFLDPSETDEEADLIVNDDIIEEVDFEDSVELISEDIEDSTAEE